MQSLADGVSRVLVDGRVYSSSAHDRGMGRYVRHVVDLLRAEGHQVGLLLFRDCYLTQDDPLLAGISVHFANYGPEFGSGTPDGMTGEVHNFTSFLSALVHDGSYQVYVDATPFLRPLRVDLFGCAVLTVFYDLIPLKHPDFYLRQEYDRRIYSNGLARVARSDGVIAISATVATEATLYLGVRSAGTATLYPMLEQRYLEPPPRSGSRADRRLFAILGSHKSKNPEGSLRLYRQLLQLDGFTIHINAPKDDQMLLIDAIPRPDGIVLTSSLSDEEKFAAQADATVVAHMSLEEGFGIPLLEALFLGTKVIALDIAMNREILDMATVPSDANVFLLPPDWQDVDLGAFERFLAAPADPVFTDQIRAGFIDHWRRAGAAVSSAIGAARREQDSWLRNVAFKIFSSLPGSSCGVADYSLAYIRSTARNVVLIYAEGEEQNVAYLPNVRTASHRDFALLSQGALAEVPTVFNFAFSPALMPGIDLMREHATDRDVVMIHEREYFGGFRAMMESRGMGDEMIRSLSGVSPEARTKAAMSLAFHPRFNKRETALPGARSPFTTEWLTRLPARFVSHLSPEVTERMAALSRSDPDIVENDLLGLEDRLDFIPLGIDARHHPGVRRAARRFRIENGMQQDDILVGHFGLVIGDLKRLPDVIDAVATFATTPNGQGWSGRRLFFVLAGRILDQDLFEHAQDLFDQAGIGDRLLYSNPKLEQDFDAQIAACDAVFCLRRQTRGQLSHIFARALSLGVPVIVNRESGYGFDPRLTVSDDALGDDITRVLGLLTAGDETHDLRARTRTQFEAVHRGDRSLRGILGENADEPVA